MSRGPGSVAGVRRMLVPMAFLILAGCGTDGAGTTSSSMATTTVAPTTTDASATTTSAPAVNPPAILAVVSGRGDDGSVEIAVWFDRDPLVTGSTLIVGFDSDDSYPGAGDVRSHLDGYALLTVGAAVDVTLVAEGEVVAAPGVGIAESWLSWASQGEVFRAFFVQDLTSRSGSVWVMATLGDESSPLGVAGVPFGESCSHRGSGVAVDEPAGGIPDAERTCLYK